MMVDQNKIKEILKQAGLEVEIESEDFEKLFSEIGLDSLDVFSFLSEIEIVTGKSFSEEEFAGLRNLNNVIDILNR